MEDLLPGQMVEDGFNSALRTALPKLESSLSLGGQRPISSLVHEFKSRHAIGEVEGRKVEKIFKEMLEERIDQVLRDIGRKSSIPKRKAEFHGRFEAYTNFVESYLGEATAVQQSTPADR